MNSNALGMYGGTGGYGTFEFYFGAASGYDLPALNKQLDQLNAAASKLRRETGRLASSIRQLKRHPHGFLGHKKREMKKLETQYGLWKGQLDQINAQIAKLNLAKQAARKAVKKHRIDRPVARRLPPRQPHVTPGMPGFMPGPGMGPGMPYGPGPGMQGQNQRGMPGQFGPGMPGQFPQGTDSSDPSIAQVQQADSVAQVAEDTDIAESGGLFSDMDDSTKKLLMIGGIGLIALFIISSRKGKIKAKAATSG